MQAVGFLVDEWSSHEARNNGCSTYVADLCRDAQVPLRRVDVTGMRVDVHVRGGGDGWIEIVDLDCG